MSFFRSSNFSAAPGWASSTCGSFWKLAATAMVGMFCATASKPCSELALMKKSILPASSSMRLFTCGPPGTMVTSRPYFAVGAVGDRLIEAAMLGLGDPVGAERDLVELLRLRGRGEQREAASERAARQAMRASCKAPVDDLRGP